METLALFGGEPACKVQLPSWPIFGEPERRRLLSVLESGNWFAGMIGGDIDTQTAELEKVFCQFQEIDYGSAVTNGTAALEVALRAAGVNRDDEVIVPAYTFIATASAVSQIGALPVIVDVNKKDLCIDPARVLEAITPKTKAIIPVHFGGQIAAMDKLLEIAEKHNLIVIEDCAHALGSVRFGKPAGSFGKAGTFSFQHGKNISGGEGGMVATNDSKIFEACVSLRSCGRRPGSPAYEHFVIGWNYRMTEWQAAVLLGQFERARSQRTYREKSASYLRAEMLGIEGFSADDIAPDTERHSYYYFIIRLNTNLNEKDLNKDRVLEALRAEGVPVSGGYPWPINHNPVYKNTPADLHSTPVSEEMCQRVIVIPHHLLLSNEEGLAAIVAAFRKVSRQLEKLR